jgi:hypothetical protein
MYRHQPYAIGNCYYQYPLELLDPEEYRSCEFFDSIGASSVSSPTVNDDRSPRSSCESSNPPTIKSLPNGTLYHSLRHSVRFIPYPTEKFSAKTPSVQKRRMTRLFFGQLPYGVTDMQLQWLAFRLAGTNLHYIERIMRKGLRGTKIATGCVFAYAEPTDALELIRQLNKRVLIDDTGVWHAENQGQQRTLDEYCGWLRERPGDRHPDRPYSTMVVQCAAVSF